MTKKEKLLKRYLMTHTLADYEAYANCPEDAQDEPVRRGLRESDDKEVLPKSKGG